MHRKRAWALSAIALLALVAELHATPPPSPWTSQDIGTVGLSGSADVTGSVWTVRGSGGDIWGSADAFHLVSTPINTSSAEMVAEVTHVDETNTFAKAGVMMRDTTDPRSRHVILDVRPNGSVELMTRPTFGGATSFVAGVTVQFPVWLRLVRDGNSFVGFVSENGTGWTQIGATTLTVANDIIAGLAVTSHDTAQVNTSTFEGVTVTPTAAGSLTPPWGGIAIGDAATRGGGGGATYTNGTFTIRGGGSDVWGTADGLQMVYQTLLEDTEISARVTSVENTHPFAKAGLMMRSGFGPADATAILDVRPDGSIEFMVRPTSGATMSFIAGAFRPTPVWLKLARHGTQFTGSFSADGVTWTTVGTAQATLPSDASGLVGMVVSSHDSSRTNTSTFDSVSVLGGAVNIVVNPGFEESTGRSLGPGWVSDSSRQTAATTDTATPFGGRVGACSTTPTQDCGIYQDITLPETGSYLIGAWVAANHAGGLVGFNISSTSATPWSNPVPNNGLGRYEFRWTTFVAHAGDVIRVWLYAPSGEGTILIDDVVVKRAPDYT